MKKRLAVIIFIGILLGGIALADKTGLWVTESTKVPIKTAEGEFDPGDIRGSYSFMDIENSFAVPVEILAKAFGIKGEASEFRIKELEELYADLENEIGTGSVRYFTMLYTGIQSELTESAYLPESAIEILIGEGKITSDHEAVGFGVKLIKSDIVEDQEVVEEEHIEPVVKGATTVAEVISKGYTKEEIADILGFDDFRNTDVIRDLCTANGLKFSEIKILFIEKD